MMAPPRIIYLVLRVVIVSFFFVKSGTSEEVKLIPPNPEIGDSLGFAVAIDGDYAIVGSPSKDSSGIGNDVGKAYIYVRSGSAWNIQDSLIASDAAAGASFGYSVDIDGDYAIVGAPFWDSTGVITNVGKAFIYIRTGSTWNEQSVLKPSYRGTDAVFGFSVAINGLYAVVGAKKDDEIAFRAGAAYVFFRQGSIWSEQEKLLGSEHEQNDRFGNSVSISGNTILVGVWYDDGEEPDFQGGGFNPDRRNSGAAYVFTRTGTVWSEQYILRPPNPVEVGWFGYSVSIDGDYAIIGTPASGTVPPSTGSAYIFHRNGTSWNLQEEIFASDGGNSDDFGYSVSISGDFVLVGAMRWDYAPPSTPQSGAAYSYLRSGSQWNEKAIIVATDFTAGDEFGTSVAINGNYSIIGSPKKDSTGIGVDIGGAYIYHSIDDLALPVTLISFESIAYNNSILLKWITASEIENQGFILKRSTNNNNSITIASYLNDPSLVGAGNSSSQNEYSFVDISIDQEKSYIYNLFSVSLNGEIKDIGQVQLSLSEKYYPDNFVLYSNYPNPFNPVTNFRVFVPKNINDLNDFKLAIYNSIGQKIKSIYTGNISEGFHVFQWNGISNNGSRVPSGIYYAVLNYENIGQVIKMTLLK